MKTGFRPWFLTVLLCAAISPMALGATTLHVGGGSKTDPNTIQAAVAMAVTGDTIVLSPGTYTGPGNCDIDLKGKALTIQSTDPLDPNVVQRTVIDCAGSQKEPHRGFFIVDCNNVMLSGLTITHGLGTAGGAVYCQRSTLTLTHCRILDNAALPGSDKDLNGGPGGGLYCESSVVKVVECLITGNTAGSGAASQDGQAGTGGNGGGLCGVKSTIDVTSSTISRNAAGAGGAGGKGTAGNGGDGGGMCGDTVRAVNCAISLNQAGSGGQSARTGRGGRGGGIYADTLNVDRCLLEANRAGDEGKTVADVNNIVGAGGGDGGGVFGNLLEIADSLIVGNRAGKGYVADASGWVDHGNGGGIWCASGAVRQCTISGNAVCRIAPSAGTVTSSSARGGAGIFCTPRTTIFGTIVYKNTPDQLAGQDANSISYSNIKPSLLASGQEDAFVNPLFMRSGGWLNGKDPNVAAEPTDPNAVWASGDYHLKTTSPMLDAGDPNYVPGKDETDLDGHARLADAAIDIGAYESQALVPVYRFWSPVSGQHFYTASAAERDKLVTRYGDFWTLEGTAFNAYTRPCEPNLLPVYRFFSDELGDHFYTIKEAEKDKLITKYADVWRLEGTAFYAYPEGRQPAGTKPVYRFWSDEFGGHFYTIREAEKDKLINQYSDAWLYEGVAWYAYEAVSATPSEPNVAAYEFSGGSQEAQCTFTLKAYIDGKAVKIDKPDLTFTPANAYMKMTVDLGAMKTTLDALFVESQILQYAATAAGSDANGIQIPLAMSVSVIFLNETPRGPFGIDPNSLAFPTTGGGTLPGDKASFTVNCSVTVDGKTQDAGTVQRATRFATGSQGTFDTLGLPGQLSARMAGTFRWSCEKQEDLLLKTTVKGSVLELYVTAAEIQTAGTWKTEASK